MTQLSLFDKGGYFARDMKKHGQESVLSNEREQWKEKMREIIHNVCVSHSRFTMDDVRDRAKEWNVDAPHHCNSYGSIMRVASSNNWAAMTGEYVHSTNPRARGRMQAVWKSLIYEKE